MDTTIEQLLVSTARHLGWSSRDVLQRPIKRTEGILVHHALRFVLVRKGKYQMAEVARLSGTHHTTILYSVRMQLRRMRNRDQTAITIYRAALFAWLDHQDRVRQSDAQQGVIAK